MSDLKITKKIDGARKVFIDGKDITESLCISNININVNADESEMVLTIPIVGDIEIEDSDVFLVKKHTSETETEEVAKVGELGRKRAVKVKTEVVSNKIPYEIVIGEADEKTNK